MRWLLAIWVVFAASQAVADELLIYAAASTTEAMTAAGDAFTPEFARIRPGECVLVVNHTDNAFTTKFGDVAPQGQTEFCFPNVGVTRVRLDTTPFSGGFVYVDEH